MMDQDKRQAAANAEKRKAKTAMRNYLAERAMTALIAHPRSEFQEPGRLIKLTMELANGLTTQLIAAEAADIKEAELPQ
jgi:hypothetical protein